MEMLLMGVCISVLGLTVAALAFGAATRDADKPAFPSLRKPKPAMPPARFFVDSPELPAAAAYTRVPIEALLLQIESHVRLEQAAAESFLESPTSSQLHSRTSSPLVN